MTDLAAGVAWCGAHRGAPVAPGSDAVGLGRHRVPGGGRGGRRGGGGGVGGREQAGRHEAGQRGGEEGFPDAQGESPVLWGHGSAHAPRRPERHSDRGSEALHVSCRKPDTAFTDLSWPDNKFRPWSRPQVEPTSTKESPDATRRRVLTPSWKSHAAAPATSHPRVRASARGGRRSGFGHRLDRVRAGESQRRTTTDLPWRSRPRKAVDPDAASGPNFGHTSPPARKHQDRWDTPSARSPG